VSFCVYLVSAGFSANGVHDAAGARRDATGRDAARHSDGAGG